MIWKWEQKMQQKMELGCRAALPVTQSYVLSLQ